MRTIRDKYQKCFKTRSNIWGNILKFKKRFQNKKWSYMKYLKFGPKQVNKYGPGSKYFFKLKHLYKINLIEKQKLKYFYGNLLQKKLQKYFNKIKLKNNLYNEYIGIIESRLDIVLYRAQFSISIFSAQELINHRFILVNNKIITYCGFLVKPGDIITLKTKKLKRKIKQQVGDNFLLKRFLKCRYLNKYLNQNHLEVNYSILTIIFINKPKITKLYYPFSLYLKNSINYFYK